jgi:hypothetical protein
MVRTTVLTPEQEQRSHADESAAGAPDTREHCEACRAELAEDQEWCLECGAARTRVHAPPDWRVGLLIVLAVMAVVAIVVAVVWP